MSWSGLCEGRKGGGTDSSGQNVEVRNAAADQDPDKDTACGLTSLDTPGIGDLLLQEERKSLLVKNQAM